MRKYILKRKRYTSGTDQSSLLLLAIIQIGVAIIGLVSGINFLKLKAWSRNAVEILTWVLLLFMVGFGIFWEYGWLSTTQRIK